MPQARSVRLFVHGAGRAGRAAWPAVPDGDAVFLDLTGMTAMRERVSAIAEAARTSDTVIAHSAGAVPVALAAAEGLISPRLLVLLEPALYDVARGSEAIEAHITAMTEARHVADRGDLFGFWKLVRPLMFSDPADPSQWAEERDRAARFAAIVLPWGHGLDGTEIAPIATIVVTGGWNAEYEVIAEALTRHGARHVRLEGHRHRPQDHADFPSLLTAWEEEVTA